MEKDVLIKKLIDLQMSILEKITLTSEDIIYLNEIFSNFVKEILNDDAKPKIL